MMLIGRLFKEPGGWWGAEVPMVGVFTQGRSRKAAKRMLEDAFESLINQPGLELTVEDYDDQDHVSIEASDASAFAAFVLQRLREESGQSLADVAKALGRASRNAYARYEQGEVVPTIEKFDELLRAVSADTALIIGPRRPALPARATRDGSAPARSPASKSRRAR